MDTATATERRTAPAPTAASVQPDDEDVTTPLERLLKEKAAAQQRLKRAQDAFAKLEAKEKKIETRFKLKLGDWLLTACKAAKKSAFNEVVVLSSRIDQPIPDELSAWLDQLDRAEEARKKAEEEAKKKK